MLKITTVTHAVHSNTITFDAPPNHSNDGGLRWLTEAFKVIHLNSQVGTLTVQFGLGGSVCAMKFEERETIPQKNIEFGENGDSEILRLGGSKALLGFFSTSGPARLRVGAWKSPKS